MFNLIIRLINCYLMYDSIKTGNYALASIAAFAVLSGLLTMKIQEFKNYKEEQK